MTDTNNTLLGISDDETLISDVKKHFMGLVQIWFFAGLIAALILGMMYVLIGNEDTLFQDTVIDVTGVVTGIGGLLLLFVALVAFIASWIYRASKLTLTTENLIQHLQKGIFSRQISQLNIGNVQDVTVQQHGPIARIFNYGTLTIETAGEQVNYKFTFAPDPNRVANEVMEAHEKYIETVDTGRVNK